MKDLPTHKQQLIAYIKKNLAKGYTSDAIKYSIISQGHSRTAVENALKKAANQLNAETPKIVHTVYTEKKISDAPEYPGKSRPKLRFIQAIKGLFKRS